MNNNMYINVEQLNSSIERIKKVKERLSIVFNKQKENTAKLFNVWNGNTGDKVYDELKKHNDHYDNYINRLNEKIIFLEKIRDAYLKHDDILKNKIDENSQK